MKFAEIRQEFIKELIKDEGLLLTYHSFVSCFFMDKLGLEHSESNALACKFLKQFFDPLTYNYEKLIGIDTSMQCSKLHDKSSYNHFIGNVDFSNMGKLTLNDIPLKKVIEFNIENKIDNLSILTLKLFCDKVDLIKNYKNEGNK